MQLVKKGNTLLVDGPARVQLIAGKASILSAPVKEGDNIIIRRGRRMPFEVSLDTSFELTLGELASAEEIDGSSIPSSWKDTVNQILRWIERTKENKTVLVIGGVDCGKSSFCTYLTNSALAEVHNVILIDGDLGQSDLGPSGTVGFCFVKEPVIDLFRNQPEDLLFTGVTSPRGKVEVVLDALVALKKKALEKDADIIIINTDGWIEGDDATKYKIRLVKKISPNIIVVIQGINDLTPMLIRLEDAKIFTIDPPIKVKQRDRDTRRMIRESAYRKYLRDAKVRSFPLRLIEEKDITIITESDIILKSRVEEILRLEVPYFIKASDFVAFVVGKKTDFKEEEIKKAEALFGRKALGLHEGDEKGLLVALKDVHGKVLGFGTIYNIDSKNNTIKISTPVNEEISKIQIGRIKLGMEGNEVGLIPESFEVSQMDISC